MLGLTELLGLPENQAKYRTRLADALRGVSLRTKISFDTTPVAEVSCSFTSNLPTNDDLTPLEASLLSRLHEVVTELATIEGRNVFHPIEYARCASWLEGRLHADTSSALARSGVRITSQHYTCSPRFGSPVVTNIEASFPGASSPEEIVVVGSHYDSIELHDVVRNQHGNCPAANDNATGVAASIAIAHLLARSIKAGAKPERSVRIVLFANEEPPFFWTRDMGSVRYADACASRRERIVAMLTPETLGCYSDEPNTQRLPLGIGRSRVGTRGNWLGFFGLSGSGDLMRQSVAAFRNACLLRCVGAELPAIVPMAGASDHWSFWRRGYPALMITDTAPFRYNAYHQSTDTPEQIHWPAFARATAGIWHVVRTLARIPDADLSLYT